MVDTLLKARRVYLRFDEPLEIHNQLFGDWRMVRILDVEEFMVEGDEAIFTWGRQTFVMPVSNIASATTALERVQPPTAPQFNYRAAAWETYRTTEPGDPARRGIGAYL